MYRHDHTLQRSTFREQTGMAVILIRWLGSLMYMKPPHNHVGVSVAVRIAWVQDVLFSFPYNFWTFRCFRFTSQRWCLVQVHTLSPLCNYLEVISVLKESSTQLLIHKSFFKKTLSSHTYISIGFDQKHKYFTLYQFKELGHIELPYLKHDSVYSFKFSKNLIWAWALIFTSTKKVIYKLYAYTVKTIWFIVYI